MDRRVDAACLADHTGTAVQTQRQLQERQHGLQRDLPEVEGQLYSFLLRHKREARGMPASIMARARALWEKEVRRIGTGATGWVRPWPDAERLNYLGARISELRRAAEWWVDPHGRAPSLRETELCECVREYEALCKSLGVADRRDAKTIYAISKAVEEGAAQTPEGEPKDWVDYPWLHEPPAWDPDRYVTHVLTNAVHGNTLHAGMPLDDLLEVALAVLLGGDRDRSRFEWMMRLAKFDAKDCAVGGISCDEDQVELREDVGWKDCSLIRWWMYAGHDHHVDQGEQNLDEWVVRCKLAFDEDLLTLGRDVLEMAEALGLVVADAPEALVGPAADEDGTLDQSEADAIHTTHDELPLTSHEHGLLESLDNLPQASALNGKELIVEMQTRGRGGVTQSDLTSRLIPGLRRKKGWDIPNQSGSGYYLSAKDRERFGRIIVPYAG